MFGQRVGGVLIGQRASDDVSLPVIPCRSTPFRAVDALLS